MTDPLDGFRGRDEDLSDEEEILAAVTGLRELHVDPETVRLFVMSEKLTEALADPNSMIGRLADYCVELIKDNSMVWANSDDPTSEECKQLHLESRAARIVLGWVNSVINTGKVAAQELEEMEPADD